MNLLLVLFCLVLTQSRKAPWKTSCCVVMAREWRRRGEIRFAILEETLPKKIRGKITEKQKQSHMSGEFLVKSWNRENYCVFLQ